MRPNTIVTIQLSHYHPVNNTATATVAIAVDAACVVDVVIVIVVMIMIVMFAVSVDLLLMHLLPDTATTAAVHCHRQVTLVTVPPISEVPVPIKAGRVPCRTLVALVVWLGSAGGGTNAHVNAVE